MFITKAFGYNGNTFITVLNVGGYSSTLGFAVLAGKMVGPMKYVPLIGVIAGLVRALISCADIFFDTEDYASNPPAIHAHLIRGLGEMCGLGALFLVADVTASLFDRFRPDWRTRSL